MNISDISTEDLLAEITKRIDHTPDAVDPQPLTTFDFEDGYGPVPAHQHPNGGGWVADTATVDDTAYVGPTAQISDDARVSTGRWKWLDALRNAEHGMSMGENCLLAELVRKSSDNWTSNRYQRSVLHAHGLDQEGVFVTWPSTATLAKVFGCSEKYVRNLSKRLQDRGYLTVFLNAGGTDENLARSHRPNLYVIDARCLPLVKSTAPKEQA